MSIGRHTRREAMTITAASAGALALGGCSEDEADKPKELAKLDDIPVGKATWLDLPGGRKLPGNEHEQVVVFRSDEKTINAYSNICTHGECLVKKPKPENKLKEDKDKTLFCFCHNAQFNAETGEVLDGPPPKPLNKVRVHVAGGKVMTGSGEDS